MDRSTVIVAGNYGMGPAEETLAHKLMTTCLGVLDTGNLLPAAWWRSSRPRPGRAR